MNNATNPPARNARTPDMGIAWESLPSLSHLVARDRREATPWADTRPVGLDDLVAIDDFEEPLEGLAIREVNEPEIFDALFGAAGRA